MRIANTVAALWVAIIANAQWNFTVDSTFQTQIIQRNVNSLLLNEDGTLIASGRMLFPGEWSEKTLAQLLPDGTRDETFSNSGQGGSTIKEWQPDRFYVAGNYNPRRIWRQTGLIDASFAVGTNVVPYFTPVQGGDYHVYPDGSVLISGNHLLNDSIRGFMGWHQLIWFTNTGHLDTTRTHRTGGSCAIYRFKELPNGQFICNGLCNQFNGEDIDRIFRVNADGSVDTTFQTGVYTGSVGGYLPLSDGRVYVAGNFRISQAPEDTLRLVRFTSSGELDPGFTIPVFSNGSTPGVSGIYGSSVQHWLDGNLLVTGTFQFVNGQPRRGICLLDTNGAVLPAFADNGVGPFTYMNYTYASIDHLVYDTVNAKLYICGAYNGYHDGINYYPEQNFITRLNVEELNVAVQDEEPPKTQFRIHPNPAIDQVTFIFDQVSGGKASIVIRDLTGKTIALQDISRSSDQITWNSASLAPGIYLVDLMNEGQVLKTEKLVIQR